MRLSVQIEFDKILDLSTSKTTVIVGRANDVADLVINHPSISRRHCKIEYIDKEFHVTDLKSSNGIYIDGVRIPPMVKTKIPAKSTLKIAKLECELSNKITEAPAQKIESQQSSGDFTSTIRLARIDVEKNILETREVTKSPPKVKGPRNPITHMEPVEKKNPKSRSFFRKLVFMALIGLGYYLYSKM